MAFTWRPQSQGLLDTLVPSPNPLGVSVFIPLEVKVVFVIAVLTESHVAQADLKSAM